VTLRGLGNEMTRNALIRGVKRSSAITADLREPAWSRTRKLKNDPCMIRIAFRCSSSVDELRQLVNSLRDDMSLAGSRPVSQQELHKRFIFAQKARLL
jgi:lipopolysaccharide/colanic/teichoic acid biosynthesis glycosyltransferase